MITEESVLRVQQIVHVIAYSATCISSHCTSVPTLSGVFYLFYILFSAHYESLQDKLAQLRDAREALDALRDDHAEKKRREREELERQRQIQMALKLDIMRQKKHVRFELRNLT